LPHPVYNFIHHYGRRQNNIGVAGYIKLDAQCNKQAIIVGLLLTTLGDGG